MKTLGATGRWVLLGLLLVSARQAGACGFNWDKPQTHFEGMDEVGHVMFVDTLGSLALKDGSTLPLWTMFKSDWNKSSPYLGQGWMLPLLESHIVQVDDNTFQMWQPDGRYQYMGRDATDNNILNGQMGWKAEIRSQDTITAWAPCGWKLTFEEGKITSITTPQNDVLEMIYRGGQVAEVREGGAPILSVDVNPNTGQVDGLVVNGKKVALEQANKPLVQVMAGRNVVGQVSPSLSRVTYPDGTTAGYKFGVDDKLNPMLTTRDHVFQWNPATRVIARDNDWTYNIVPGSGPDPNDGIQFTRTNGKKQSEYFCQNGATGTTTERGLDGVTTVTTRFVNAGPLSNRVRGITQVKNGVSAVLQRYDYDESGRLIRETNSAGIVKTYAYDAAGRLINPLRTLTAQQLKVMEQQLLQSIAEAKNDREKMLRYYNLGLFYAIRMKKESQALIIANSLSSRQLQFNIILHMYDYDNTLSPKQKIDEYKKLLTEFPEQANILNGLITLRETEL